MDYLSKVALDSKYLTNTDDLDSNFKSDFNIYGDTKFACQHLW